MKSRRSLVAAGLAKAGSVGVSGEQLGELLGISRVAIAKHITALRDAGYEISAVHGEGYRLNAMPQRLVPVEVERLLADSLWTRIEGSPETASTNDDCKALAHAGALAGTVVMSGRQTGGKGRLGRMWVSPAGGVYLSALLQPSCAPADVAPLALACALGVARGLESLGVDCQVKWPNDVLIGGRKVAGILLEMSAEADRVNWVVVGCGINVARAEGCFAEAAFLADVVEVPPSNVAAAVLDGIAVAYREFEAGGFAALRAAYESRHSLAACEVVVRDGTGRIVAAGESVGVDDAGRLLVRDASGIVPVVAGEVTLRQPGGSDG
ncbi:MAG: biotin--[acetyl-CoA-carboxylase] ligase [Actinomycetota bacterium]|nr:biotin--[acetyl-CoA-carboxylase] ligase [Actinomycetota bacterium]MDP3630030.1 biotin--[acetyl-CoA-carboxylase] ligase [Actinomycetota bacterium]